ncbi:hypothetical protein CEXT_415001 [Caerostris extrusa]|uniref:Transmembrane protein n=1 Tax=Caerostris extrusa TaxID=172846 RepID=A0AAV4PBR5_CAEEX|nr:hypothetical protein CEXT_415001 [Caerostris extrusa]
MQDSYKTEQKRKTISTEIHFPTILSNKIPRSTVCTMSNVKYSFATDAAGESETQFPHLPLINILFIISVALFFGCWRHFPLKFQILQSTLILDQWIRINGRVFFNLGIRLLGPSGRRFCVTAIYLSCFVM